jgi:hypothetical protein
MAFRSWSGLTIKGLFPLWFILTTLAALVNVVYLRPSGIKLLDYYFNDFISIPLMLHASSLLMGFIYGRIPYYLSVIKIALAVIATSVFFELVLPRMNYGFIADPIDVLVYAIGGLVYYLIQRINFLSKE